MNRLAENARTHDRSRRSRERSSSELLITALFVPLRAVGVTAPPCLLSGRTVSTAVRQVPWATSTCW